MTEFLKLFQRIAATTDLTLSEELKSQEIQHSAAQLSQTIQPCLDELYRAAVVLQELLQPCLAELAQAEAVWKSKPQIMSASAIAVREHVGHLSGYCFKLQRLKLTLIQTVTEEAKNSWQTRAETIKEKWFVDQASRNPKGVNLPDKERFIQVLNEELDSASIALGENLKESFQPIQAQLQLLQLSKVQDHLDLLDAQRCSEYEPLLSSLNLSHLYLKLEKPYSYLPDGTQNLLNTAASLLEKLTDQGFLVGNTPAKAMMKSWMGHGFLPLTWEHFSQFSKEIDVAIAQIAKAIVEDRIELILQLLNQSIQFYDDFLEQQQRYQQETPDQRQSEQNWLMTRRQDLEQVRDDAARVIDTNREF
ncbi:MAG: hypothetical protein HC780_10935 [Leptolyngbyaceae cyanobacterium CSU_1_3]|nr:hypothetical protein [Leptolyngbyaceae cyanobacterium CSU_1_3]